MSFSWHDVPGVSAILLLGPAAPEAELEHRAAATNVYTGERTGLGLATMMKSENRLFDACRHVVAMMLCAFAIAAHADGASLEESDGDGPRYPAYLLELPESVSEILIAEADSAKLWRFRTRANDIIGRESAYVSIGHNGVGKQRAWDRKTPLGVYFITEQLDTSKMHEKYGVAAFPLDYPNAWDRRNSRTGDGIWLHGVDRRNPERPPRDTDGCLALPNEDLLKLIEALELHVTPVIVARELKWASREELSSRRLEFRTVLDRWRYSLEQGDLLAYLSLYDDEFRNRSMDKAEWSAYRMEVFRARAFASVALKDVLLIADPEEEGLYLSRFTQVASGAAGPVKITKRLYWKRHQDGAWKIVAEDNG